MNLRYPSGYLYSYLRMKKIAIILIFVSFSYGCVEQNLKLTTFTGEMIYSYLQKDTTYSECLNIMNKTGLKRLLSACESYTCVYSTNSAFKKYYASLGVIHSLSIQCNLFQTNKDNIL